MSTNQKKIILNLTPRPHLRTTQGDRIYFRIKRENLRPAGLQRLIRIEKYNNYKTELLAEAKRKQFTIPPAGLSVTFFMPMPKTWSKKKKKSLHGFYCQSRPDIDNIIKGFFDALVSEDKFIANITATKRWVDHPHGWIECSLIEQQELAPIHPPAKE